MNKEDINFNYKKLHPFKWFILQNYPFLEDSIDVLTNYQLFCKLGEMYNKQVDAINMLGIQVEGITDWFDDLDVQEEINNKLDEMAESGELGEIVGEYLDQKVDYYEIKITDSEEDILKYFGVNKPKVISFEKGDYTFTNDIVLSSNTKVLLNGSKLLTNGHNKIIGYALDSEYTAYNGVHNVEIKNGYIEQMIVLMHNENITINDVEFGYKLLDHAVQIAGCKDIQIKNCTFHGSAISSNGSNQELIQLETCTYLGQPYLAQDSVSYDHYGNYNITISDNNFKVGDGVNTHNYTCIGHHSKDDENEFCNENITISNNKFETVRYSAIRPVGFNHAIIENNTFEQNDSLNVNTIRPSWKNKNITIRNNIFSGGSSAITNVNVEQNENYLIENNRFLMTFAGTTCYLQSIKNSKIINNYFEYQTSAIGTAQTNNGEIDNIVISGNTFIAKLDGTGNYTLNIFKCTNLVVVDNYCYQISDAPFIFYRGQTEKYPLYYANNYIYNTNFNPNDVNGTNLVYNRIYNSLRRLHQASNATYTALTNQTVTWKFTEFNKAKLIIARNGNAANIQIVEIAPYELFAKLSKNRSYDITSNINGTLHYATFSITDDDKFSYSGDGSLTLISVYGYNELQI